MVSAYYSYCMYSECLLIILYVTDRLLVGEQHLQQVHGAHCVDGGYYDVGELHARQHLILLHVLHPPPPRDLQHSTVSTARQQQRAF